MPRCTSAHAPSPNCVAERAHAIRFTVWRIPMHHVVVHAHCYQPPRENPWLEMVETEPSAAPDHDWNARIDRECYARLARAEARPAYKRAFAAQLAVFEGRSAE